MNSIQMPTNTMHLGFDSAHPLGGQNPSSGTPNSTATPAARDYFDYLHLASMLAALAGQQNLNKYLSIPQLTKHLSELGVTAAHENLTDFKKPDPDLLNAMVQSDELIFQGEFQLVRPRTQIVHKNLPPAVVGQSVDTVQWRFVIRSQALINIHYRNMAVEFFEYGPARQNVEELIKNFIEKGKTLKAAAHHLEQILQRKMNALLEDSNVAVHADLNREASASKSFF